MYQLTDRGIQQALLSHYKAGLQAMPKHDIMEAFKYLESQSMALGVCFCAAYVFKHPIYGNGWVQQHCTRGKGYWGPPPSALVEKGNIKLLITSIDHRIYILEKLLNQQDISHN